MGNATREDLLKSLNKRSSNRKYWPFGLFCSAIWILLVPAVFGWWLKGEVDEEFESGLRSPEDGDAIAIPIFGFAVLNFVFVCAVNLTVWIYQRKIKRHADY